MKSGFGSILRDWLAMRRVSQLDLALKTNISQRHISFVESGRSRPSREMVAKLAEGLDLPLRVRNEILLAAGYAPLYLERRLDLAEMKNARHALERILRHHEPYPAVVTDGAWNILLQNAAAIRIVVHCVDEWAMGRLSSNGTANFMRLMFSDDGMRPHILNWRETRTILMARLIREAAANPGSPSERLRRELGEAAALPMADAAMCDEPLESTLPLELLVGNVRLRLFSTFTTFGTPQDVPLQELRIDMSFPADDETDRFLATAADVGIAGALRRE